MRTLRSAGTLLASSGSVDQLESIAVMLGFAMYAFRKGSAWIIAEH